jgi:hypothetical protein
MKRLESKQTRSCMACKAQRSQAAAKTSGGFGRRGFKFWTESPDDATLAQTSCGRARMVQIERLRSSGPCLPAGQYPQSLRTTTT